MVHHDFSSPILARYIRIQPKSWNEHISLRMELFGCYKGNILLHTDWLLIIVDKCDGNPFFLNLVNSVYDLVVTTRSSHVNKLNQVFRSMAEQ